MEFIDLPLPISQGGTGGTTVAEAKHNLNISDSAVIPNLPSAPTNPVLGELYYDTTTHDLMICTDPGNPPSVPATWASLSDVTGGVIKDIDGTSPINVSIAQDGTASLSLSATSSTATPSFGDTFETLSAPVSGGSLNGQLTKSTITIPSNAATTALAGLMSAADKGRLDNLNLAYATCDTAANAQTKIATVQAGTFALTAGALVAVKFTYTNTYDATSQNHVRLNVDDSGSKPIYYADGLPIGTNEIAFGIADYVHLYMYDGTYWVWVAYSMENRYDTMTAADYAAGTSEIGMLISPKLLKDSITYIQDLIVNNVLANYAHISNGVIDNATISYADVDELSTHYASITNGVIDSARIGYANVNGLDTHYATINLSNIGTGVITTAMIADAAITDAKMGNISANKITSGTINAANINVLNLRTDNLLVTKVNGQPVLGGYMAVDKSDPTYANQNPVQNGWYELTPQNEFVRSTDTSVQDGKTYYATAVGGSELYDQAAVDSLINNVSTTLSGNITTVSNRVNTTVKSSIQLWRTRTTQQGAPSKPFDNEPTTQHVYTDDYQTPDIWTTVVPEYDDDYPDYYYCWQYEYPTNPATYGWSAIVKDIATSETQVTAIHADTTATTAQTTASAAAQAVSNLQTQVDGMLEVWSGAVDPRPNEDYPSDWTVPPASNWNTPALKSKHIGDLYYNTTDGTMWQWTYDSQTATYSWADAPESIAAEALAVANGKRRVFTAQSPNHPTPPYDIGDLWVNGSEVRYAVTAKAVSQQYSENDWTLTATDDTAADAAQASADAAQATANANIKSSEMLWFAKAAPGTGQSRVYPNPPTPPITDADANTHNAWTLAVPVYNSDYPDYYYCYQQQLGNDSWQCTDVIYDEATTNAQAALTRQAWQEWESHTFKDVVDEQNEQSTKITTIEATTIYGGSNLIDNSESVTGSGSVLTDPYSHSNVEVYDATFDGEQAYYCSGPRYLRVDFPQLEVGQSDPIKYTFSFDCTRGNAQPVFITIDGTTTNLGNTSATSGEWKRFSHTFTSTINTTYALLRVNNANAAGTNQFIAAFRHFKLERGELSTPWGYSMPDVLTHSQTVTGIYQDVDSISLTVDKITDGVDVDEVNLSSLNVGVGEITSRVENLKVGARNLLMETATDNNGIATSTTSYLARYKLSEPLTVNTEYVWGLDLSTSTKKAMRLYINDNSSASNAITDWIVNNNSVLESKRYSGSFTATADMVAAQGSTNLNAYIAVYVSNNANGSGATYNSYSGNTNTQVSTAAGYIRTLNIQGKTDSSWRSINGISVNTTVNGNAVSMSIPATIRSAGSIYDSLQVDKTNVTITRRVALMTFNGTEDWQKSVTTGGKPAFWLQNTVLPASLFVNKERYAAGYTTSTADWDTLGNMYLGVPYKATSGGNANAGVLFVNDAYSTVDEWKAALQASNITISYATPDVVSDTVSNISNIMQIGASVTVSTANLETSTSIATPFSMFTDDGTAISHMKLEEGNLPTEWTNAPEELTNLANSYTLFEQTANGFISTASSQINGISAQMSEMNETIIEQNSNFVQVTAYNSKMTSIDASITQANTNITNANQNISAANENYTSLNAQINGVEGESTGLVGTVNALSEQSNTLGKYLKFDEQNALVVGSLDAQGNSSPMKVQITDKAINFIDGDMNNPVAYINQKMLYIENEQILKNLRFGDFVFFEREGSHYTYEQVKNTIPGYSSKNPRSEGWYELSGSTYTLTNDTTVNNSKTYYQALHNMGLKWVTR